MRNMWVKIGLGAGLVFGVGMMFITLGRQVKAQVANAIEHGGRVPVPLAMLPFHVDMNKVGQIKTIEVSKDPVGARTLHVVASMKEGTDREWLAGCLLQVDGDNTGGGFFSCVPADGPEAADLVRIGEVTLEPGGLTRPIVVRREVAEKVFRHTAHQDGNFSLISDGNGTSLQVTDGQGRKVVQLQADSNGAYLRVRNESGKEVVRIQAGSGGANIKVRADSQP
ncbi:MAG TPA: hypothetical protein VF862_10110 [Gemmatimonadales bacterium]